jgi:hypothetical protein
MAARLEGTLRMTHCASLLGPLVEIQASLLCAGLRLQVIFRNRPTETDPAVGEFVRPLVLVSSEERIALRPRRAVRGIPERASVSIQLVDRDGAALADAQETEACVDGTHAFQIPCRVGLTSMVWFAARDWSERGPRIGVSGEVIVPRGVAARLAFQPLADERRRGGGFATELWLARPGTAWIISERILESGSPQHAWVFARFAEGGERRTGGEEMVGHCVTP